MPRGNLATFSLMQGVVRLALKSKHGLGVSKNEKKGEKRKEKTSGTKICSLHR